MGDQLSGCLGADLHISDLELDCLILADRFAELNTLLRISNCFINTSLSYADADRCAPGTGQIQSLHSGDEAGSFLSQTVLSRDPYILQKYITGGGAADTHLVLMIANA